jgi:hypothetical protein
MNAPAPSSSPVSGIWERILGWLPAWLGFVIIIGIGVILVILGITANSERVGLLAWGIAMITSGAIAWWSASKAEPRGNPFDRSFGAVLSRIEQLPWLIILALFLVAVIVTIVT